MLSQSTPPSSKMFRHEKPKSRHPNRSSLPTNSVLPKVPSSILWKVAPRQRNFLKDTPGLRDHAADTPMGTKWDGYEFILLIAAHSERHTNQIKEVKADPSYPKN
jgi:hypothetical protein